MADSVRLEPGMVPYPGYRLVKHLGAGGFGEVWEAMTPDCQTAALKFLRTGSSHAAAQEIRTLQAIRELRHRHLIRIDRVWCFHSWIVIAMELADGSLTDLYETYQASQNTPITPEHACLLLTDAADALDFLNTRRHSINGRCVAIQHCDVKPGNLLLIGDNLKVADFGLSSLLGSPMEFRSSAGTLAYCAPEVFHGRLSSSTDQFALAVTYCVLRGGQYPFPSPPRNFDARYRRPAPDLNMLSAAERPLIARALDPVAHHRWSTCRDLFDRLSAVVCNSAAGLPVPKGSSAQLTRPV